MTSGNDSDVLVVGGGISGLSMARLCADMGLSVRVLEAGDAPGGCLHSAHLPGGFWFEMGAHTCYNSYGGLLNLIEATGMRGKLLPRAKVPFRLVVDGEVRTIASQLSFLELALHAPRIFTLAKQGRTVREYYGSLVGAGNYNRVFGPLLSAVPSQNADEFPASMLFKKRPRDKTVLRSFAVDGGLQAVALALAADPRIQVEINASATAISKQAGGLLVACGDGRTFAAQHVALAVPPPQAARLCTDVAPGAATALRTLRTTGVRSYGIACPKAQTALAPTAGLIPLKGPFFSAVTRDTVPDANLRAFTFHWPAETPESQALPEMCRILKVQRADIALLAQRDVVLPSPVRDHADTVAAIDAALADTNLAVTGNYFDGLAIEDCVQRSRCVAARWSTGLVCR